jgi:hypothetical protein
VAGRLRAEGVDRHRRGKARRAREEGSELSPALNPTPCPVTHDRAPGTDVGLPLLTGDTTVRVMRWMGGGIAQGPGVHRDHIIGWTSAPAKGAPACVNWTQPVTLARHERLHIAPAPAIPAVGTGLGKDDHLLHGRENGLHSSHIHE